MRSRHAGPWLFVLLVALAFAGCKRAPQGLQYPNTVIVLVVHRAMPPAMPTTQRGTPTEFSVEPALPSGLVLDSNTGRLVGTPTEPAAAMQYTITARNSAGETNTVITLTVRDEPPSELAYSTNPASYTVGRAIAENKPSNQKGRITRYSVKPELPAGLSLNTDDGTLSGTPTTPIAPTSFTIIGSNASGETSVELQIAVEAPTVDKTQLLHAAFPKATEHDGDLDTTDGLVDVEDGAAVASWTQDKAALLVRYRTEVGETSQLFVLNRAASGWKTVARSERSQAPANGEHATLSVVDAESEPLLMLATVDGACGDPCPPSEPAQSWDNRVYAVEGSKVRSVLTFDGEQEILVSKTERTNGMRDIWVRDTGASCPEGTPDCGVTRYAWDGKTYAMQSQPARSEGSDGQ